MSIKKIQKTEHPSENVKVEQEIEVIDGEHMDTSIQMTGSFSVSGSSREEFLKKLGSLIDEYRI